MPFETVSGRAKQRAPLTIIVYVQDDVEDDEEEVEHAESRLPLLPRHFSSSVANSRILPVRLSYCARDADFYRVVQIASFDGKVRGPPRNGIWISAGNGGEDEAVVSRLQIHLTGIVFRATAKLS